MRVTKILVAGCFAMVFMLVWNSQSSFGQQGHTFRTSSGRSIGTAANSSFGNTSRTPSMTRPTTDRGRSIGVGAEGGDLAEAAREARAKRDAQRRGGDRGRSIGTGAFGSGYSNIHRRSSTPTRQPNPGGATAQFF